MRLDISVFIYGFMPFVALCKSHLLQYARDTQAYNRAKAVETVL